MVLCGIVVPHCEVAPGLAPGSERNRVVPLNGGVEGSGAGVEVARACCEVISKVRREDLSLHMLVEYW